jgi:hypothetical protein
MIFDIVNQLNRGAALIASREEREWLAELNLLAGRRARQSAAYSSALTYLAAGRALLTRRLPGAVWGTCVRTRIPPAECEICYRRIGRSR